MGDKTGIEWTDATWNPTSGCTKVSQGCKNCYAERVFPRAYGKSGRKFTELAMHPERLDYPIRWKRPRRIFVDSMSDLFHEHVPTEFIDRVFATMILAQQHTYQVLTKRIGRMYDYLTDPLVHYRWNEAVDAHPRREAHFGGVTRDWFRDFAKHIWVGVSVEDNNAAVDRIPWLLLLPAPVKFLSCEPLIGPFRLEYFIGTKERHEKPLIDWVIVGGESGPGARPMAEEWCERLRDACAAAGTAFFMKQGSAANWPAYKSFTSFPPELQVREYPQ